MTVHLERDSGQWAGNQVPSLGNRDIYSVPFIKKGELTPTVQRQDL